MMLTFVLVSYTILSMKFKLTKLEAQEIEGKLWILHDEQDLLDDYGVTESEVHQVIKLLPLKTGGEWEVPEGKLLAAVRGEIADAAKILRHQAGYRENFKNAGQQLACYRLAGKLETMFGGAA